MFRKRNEQSGTSSEPISPHPERPCDETCDVTDDAHGGVVWFGPDED